MRNRRKLSVGMLVCVVGLVGLLSVGRAEAEKEQDDEHHRHKDRPERGLSLCLDRLVTCQTDLGACEAEPNVVFPGDGQEGTSLDFGLAHGPALSYTDNGDGTFTDNNTKLVWEKKNAANGVPNFSNPHDVDNSYTWTEEDEDLTDPDGTLFLDFLPRLNTPPVSQITATGGYRP